MRIQHVSDTHGYKLELFKPNEYDCLIHSGDFCTNFSRGTLPYEEEMQTQWLNDNREELVEWLQAEYKPVYLLRGNHDFVDPATVLNHPNIHSLSSRMVDLPDGSKAYGYPWTPYFNGEWWGELRSELEQASVDSIRPYVKECDVFVSHGPMYGILDRVQDEHYKHYIGSKHLRDMLRELGSNAPPLILHGHVHEAASRKPIYMSFEKDMTLPVSWTAVYNSATITNLIDFPLRYI